jgi:hypothetical protein
MTPEDRMKELRSDATPTEAEWLEFRSTAHKSLARRRVAAVAGGLGLVVAIAVGGYAVANMDAGDERGQGIAATPTASATDEPSPDTSPSSDAQPEQLVQLWYVEEDDTLLLTHWPIEGSESPERAAVETLVSLIPGPLGETGATTAIPEGTEVSDLSISDGTATVTLAGDFPDDTDTQQEFAHAQIVYTLTQFSAIKDVSVSWVSSESGGVSSGAETRKTYEHLLPPIVVESPMDGAEVGRSFELSGIANVFEANVSWRVEDMEGKPLQEGFVTATCGSGCWGTFQDKIFLKDLPSNLPGDGVLLHVFQASAEDGSPMNMVTLPLNVQI